MKVIYIGANHSGIISMKQLKKLNPECEIVVYEKNNVTSFLACGIALNVSGVVNKTSNLFYSSPKMLKEEGIDVKINHEITKIDKVNKIIYGINLETNEKFSTNYDKLVIASGSKPIIPNLKGIKSKNIYLVKTYQHAQKLWSVANNQNIKNISIIGAGYIGIELAEAFCKQNKNVSLIDSCSNLLDKYFDVEINIKILEKLKQNKINLHISEQVEEFLTCDEIITHVKTNKSEIKADIIVMCVGFKPNTDFLNGCLKLSKNGAIITDSYRYSSDENILAIGDCSTIENKATNDNNSYIALASNAIRTGICAAYNIYEKTLEFNGVSGSNGLCIFDSYFTSVGINEFSCQKYFNIETFSSIYKDKILPDFMPNNHEIEIKTIFEKKTRRLIGVQIWSNMDTHLINAFYSLAIQDQKTLEDLLLVDQLFLPHYNKPINFVLGSLLKAKEEFK